MLAIDDVNSKDFSCAIGRLGWSGMGSFLDQVFCDINIEPRQRPEVSKDEKELFILMGKLGSYALKVDPQTPNHLAIKSMLEVWSDKA